MQRGNVVSLESEINENIISPVNHLVELTPHEIMKRRVRKKVKEDNADFSRVLKSLVGGALTTAIYCTTPEDPTYQGALLTGVSSYLMFRSIPQFNYVLNNLPKQISDKYSSTCQAISNTSNNVYNYLNNLAIKQPQQVPVLIPERAEE